MQDDTQFIEQGNAAAELLHSPAYTIAFNALSDSFMADILNSTLEDTVGREKLFMMIRALQGVHQHLQQMVHVRDRVLEDAANTETDY